jgi:hypothetical protein
MSSAVAQSLVRAGMPAQRASTGALLVSHFTEPHNKHATCINGLAHLQGPLSQPGGGAGGSLTPCMVRVQPRGA